MKNTKEMELPISVVDTIRKRQSVRTYVDESLAVETRAAIEAYMEDLRNPFDVKTHLHIVDRQTGAQGERLGTYGVIKGAHTFLGVSVPKREQALLAAGYDFENLILLATDMGLGTVWLGGTFSKSSFAKTMKVGADELFPAISPVGYPAGRRRLLERIMRGTVGSGKRKPWNQLFFRDDFRTSLSEDDAKEYRIPLEMVRLAPSSLNAQPWRVVKTEKGCHFYCQRKSVVWENGVCMGSIDIGIALSHFHQTSLELGLSGHLEQKCPDISDVPSDLQYVISWTVD